MSAWSEERVKENCLDGTRVYLPTPGRENAKLWPHEACSGADACEKTDVGRDAATSFCFGNRLALGIVVLVIDTVQRKTRAFFLAAWVQSALNHGSIMDCAKCANHNRKASAQRWLLTVIQKIEAGSGKKYVRSKMERVDCDMQCPTKFEPGPRTV
eukprot:676265-Amphidinium_carterae.1